MNYTIAEINLKNLQYNYNSIRKKTKTKVMAVVKADAYGHGMVKCTEALLKLKNKPEYFGVALLSEAIELRKSTNIKSPIVCFAPFHKELFKEYIKYNVILSVTSEDQANELLKLKTKKKIIVHFNINTGMNRLGIRFSNAVKVIEKFANDKKIVIDGIYTHFATSDEKSKDFANLQLKRFASLIEELRDKNINYGLAHAANSGAILDMENSYFDMVRPGISLYGYTPSQETTESIKLKPVMSLYSKLSAITKVNKGETVGYGRLYKASKEIRCGTIPAGYADGLSRGLSDKMKVIINNKVFPQIGRISMDRISINLASTKIKKGSKVILIGSSKNHKIDAWEWSKILNTIPYEITCLISKRVARKYVGNS